MNKILLIFVLLLVFSCKNPQKTNSKKVSPKSVTDKKDTPENHTDDCVILVTNFPSNFEDFNRIYGYDDTNGEGILYNKYEEHINDFFSCSKVSSLTKLQKAISIGVNGKWDADAVGLFQFKLLDLIKNNPKEALKVLEESSEEEASSFWHFLFDGPHPEDKQIVNNVNILSDLFGSENYQTILLKREYEKLLSQ